MKDTLPKFTPLKQKFKTSLKSACLTMTGHHVQVKGAIPSLCANLECNFTSELPALYSGTMSYRKLYACIQKY
eukprot:6881663-Ditylum_brightwellii.AAC.1